jgi:signal transduction histidine kinase
METSIKRLNDLLDKFRGVENSATAAENADISSVLSGVVRTFGDAVVLSGNLEQSVQSNNISEADLRSILNHVISNAIEASRPGDSVSVSLHTSDLQTTIAVRDKGCGMTAAFVQNELFTPMRSTKEHGHGIGAYQSRELVRAAGGTLDVESIVDQGTVVRIVIPRKSVSPKMSVGKS